MAATVIDALLVTLGLDTSQFRKGQQEVSDDLKKQREDAKNLSLIHISEPTRPY